MHASPNFTSWRSIVTPTTITSHQPIYTEEEEEEVEVEFLPLSLFLSLSQIVETLEKRNSPLRFFCFVVVVAISQLWLLPLHPTTATALSSRLHVDALPHWYSTARSPAPPLPTSPIRPSPWTRAFSLLVVYLQVSVGCKGEGAAEEDDGVESDAERGGGGGAVFGAGGDVGCASGFRGGVAFLLGLG